MAYLTDRKRAAGLGAAKTGTEHHWSMMVSSVALLLLVPLFVFTVGPVIGSSHGEMVAYFAKPFPAIVTALTLTVGLMHFKNGAQTLIEDYVHGPAKKLTIIGVICLSYAAAGTALFSIARIAL